MGEPPQGHAGGGGHTEEPDPDGEAAVRDEPTRDAPTATLGGSRHQLLLPPIDEAHHPGPGRTQPPRGGAEARGSQP